MGLTENLEQLTDIAERRDEAHYGFIKQVLLMASSLFGIIIALHKQTSASHTTRVFFSLSLILLSLGILFLTIALFAEVNLHRKLWFLWKDEVVKQLGDPMYQPKPIAEEPSKLFALVEKIAYISLLLSIISLTVYGILSF